MWLCSAREIERKGVDIIEMRNYLHFIICTNQRNPLLIEPSDRRYAVLRCSSARVGDARYFNDLAALTNDPKCAQNVFSYLANRDITAFCAQHIPHTEAYAQMKLRDYRAPFVSLLKFVN